MRKLTCLTAALASALLFLTSPTLAAPTLVGPVHVSAGLPGGASAARQVNAATVIKGAPGILVRIVVITAGSITVNDAATTGAASAANQIFSGSVSAGQVIELDWPCGTGIVVSAVTTAVVAIAYS